MDNQPIYSGQPMNSGVQPGFDGAQSGFQPQATGVAGGQVPTATLVPVSQSNNSKTTLFMVLSIVGGLVAVTFIGLFIWMYSHWNEAQTDVDSKINTAVATAVNEKTEELENQFTEREKLPYRVFTGPADYGELSFNYPKTWSVYEAKSATNGGDFEAYFNPDRVYVVGTDTINSLRVYIRAQSYDNFVQEYEDAVKEGKMTVAIRPIGGENANVYTGELPDTNRLQGIAAVFKIRDKTAVIQTDAMLFADDYYKILDSVKFNL